MTTQLLAGSYAGEGDAGLRLLAPNGRDEWTCGPAIEGARNPSFGAFSPRHGLAYFVDEEQEGALAAYRITDEGWHQVARVPTLGAEPCYVALDEQERLIAVANYGSGSVALFLLDERTGVPLKPALLRANAGSGPVADRQEGPHAHCVCFSRDQRWLFHVDLGTDEILAHPVEKDSPILGEPKPAFRAPAGSGPRHLVFHPVLPLALLVSELGNTLTVLQVNGGRLIEQQTLSTLPPDFDGENLAGHLSVDAAGERVYVSNRGHDSIAVFAWDETGALHLLQHVPSDGVSPRFFLLLETERQLLVTNQESGTITSFELLADGTLAPNGGALILPGAAFLLALPH